MNAGQRHGDEGAESGVGDNTANGRMTSQAIHVGDDTHMASPTVNIDQRPSLLMGILLENISKDMGRMDLNRNNTEDEDMIELGRYVQNKNLRNKTNVRTVGQDGGQPLGGDRVRYKPQQTSRPLSYHNYEVIMQLGYKILYRLKSERVEER